MASSFRRPCECASTRLGHVHAADQQHAHGAGPQQIQGLANVPDEIVLEWHGDRTKGIPDERREHGEAFHVRGVERIDLGLRLLERRAGLQPANVGPVVRMALAQLLLLFGERGGHP